MYSWFCEAADEGASRLDENTKNEPSADHAGLSSLLSFVKVSWRAEETPLTAETSQMSVKLRASFQSGTVSV